MCRWNYQVQGKAPGDFLTDWKILLVSLDTTSVDLCGFTTPPPPLIVTSTPNFHLLLILSITRKGPYGVPPISLSWHHRTFEFNSGRDLNILPLQTDRESLQGINCLSRPTERFGNDWSDSPLGFYSTSQRNRPLVSFLFDVKCNSLLKVGLPF